MTTEPMHDQADDDANFTLDPDMEFVIDYLTGGLSPEREAEFEQRFLEDEAFFDKIAPFWKVWHAGVNDREVMAKYHPETELPPVRAPRASRAASATITVVSQPTMADRLRHTPSTRPRSWRDYVLLGDFLFPVTPFRAVRYAVAAAFVPFWIFFVLSRLVPPVLETIAANHREVQQLRQTTTPRRNVNVPRLPPTVALPAPSTRPDPVDVAPPVKRTPALAPAATKPESLKAVQSDSVKPAVSKKSDKLINAAPAKTVAPTFPDSEYDEVSIGGGVTALVKGGSHFTYQSSSPGGFTMVAGKLDGEAVFEVPAEGHPLIALTMSAGRILLGYGGRYAVRCLPGSNEILLTVAEGHAGPTGHQVDAGKFARIARDGTVTLTDGTGFPIVPPKALPPESPEDRR
jgi:hypothetical protein